MKEKVHLVSQLMRFKTNITKDREFQFKLSFTLNSISFFLSCATQKFNSVVVTSKSKMKSIKFQQSFF